MSAHLPAFVIGCCAADAAGAIRAGTLANSWLDANIVSSSTAWNVQSSVTRI